MKLGEIEFVYSDRRDEVHREVVGLVNNNEASNSCLGWKGINNGVLVPHSTI